MNAAHIAAHFDAARQTSEKQWEAKCPCHEDRTSSLCIGDINSHAAGMYCQAGCNTETVLAKVGLKMSDLFTKPIAKNSTFNIVAAYPYKDEQSTLLYEAVRMDPKDFRQRKPKPGGGWEWKLGDVRRVLYRLPELVAADPLEVVFVVEGEKDVDRLRSLGLIATTSVGGASKGKTKWKPEYNESLRGRRVVAIPDNDPPGEQHAITIANSLTGTAASVKLLRLPNLPDKGDVSDWLDAGGTADQLKALADATPEWKPTAPPPKPKASKGETDENELPPGIRNFTMDVVAAEDDDEETTVKAVPLPMREVLTGIWTLTEGWPKRVGGGLFVHEAEQVHWLESTSGMFGWAASRTGIVEWKKLNGAVTKEETFAELRRTAENFTAVEEVPHVPPLANHYYACGDVQLGDGKALRELLDRFTPATDIDRDLILAVMLTIIWGGPHGARPAFLVTSDDGRGAGKSKLAQMIAMVFGGALEFSPKDDMQKIKTRLLSADALVKRVCLLDNVKLSKFSWAEWEGLITSPIISGHRMYIGEGSRPNTLVWLVTINGPMLSTDIASRAVVIKVKKPTYTGDWESETLRFILAHRREIIADLAAILLAPAVDLGEHTRFGVWDKAIISRLPEPNDAMAVISSRRLEVDAEIEESAMIEEFFADQLKRLDYDPETTKVFIPSQIIARWWNWAMGGDRQTPTAVSRSINQQIGEGKLSHLRKASKAYGRGFVWVGEESTSGVFIDLQNRLETAREARGESQERQNSF